MNKQMDKCFYIQFIYSPSCPVPNVSWNTKRDVSYPFQKIKVDDLYCKTAKKSNINYQRTMISTSAVIHCVMP